MKLIFSSHDIEKWADFSGDTNAIHFDVGAAQQLGVQNIIAHGMLALLPIKKMIFGLHKATLADWLQFKASFKNPILQDDTGLLTVRQRNSKLTFKFMSMTTNQCSLVGSLEAQVYQPWHSDAAYHVVDPVEVRDKFLEFQAYFEKDFEPWIWLDALIFSNFIRFHIRELFNRLSGFKRPESDTYGLHDLNDRIIVQISHQVRFSAFLDSFIYADAQEFPQISYQIDHVDIIERPGSAFGTLGMGVFVDGAHMMTIEQGLMVKALSSADELTLSSL